MNGPTEMIRPNASKPRNETAVNFKPETSLINLKLSPCKFETLDGPDRLTKKTALKLPWKVKLRTTEQYRYRQLELGT
jgi:hypothetical protein